jgi:hypothetical protein
MKIKALLVLAIVAALSCNSAALAATPGTTEITGKILAITPAAITVQSGTDVWVIQRVPTTKITGEATVGATVTVSYVGTDAQKKEGTASNRDRTLPAAT